MQSMVRGVGPKFSAQAPPALAGKSLLDMRVGIRRCIVDILSSSEVVGILDGKLISAYPARRGLASGLLALLHEGEGCALHNTSSDQTVSVQDLACWVRDLASLDRPVVNF